MSATSMERYWTLPRSRLDALLALLRERGYRIIGPQVRDGAVVFTDLNNSADLPRGMRDIQSPGHYRLQNVGDDRCFAWANTAQGIKPSLFAPEETLWQCTRDATGQLKFDSVIPDAGPLAIIGARACDLAGLGLLDAHFLADTRQRQTSHTPPPQAGEERMFSQHDNHQQQHAALQSHNDIAPPPLRGGGWEGEFNAVTDGSLPHPASPSWPPPQVGEERIFSQHDNHHQHAAPRQSNRITPPPRVMEENTYCDDPHYAARRRGLFLVAVDCSHPAETCFCASTGDGPAAAGGYDLALTELDDGYLLRSGSAAGDGLLTSLALDAAASAHIDQAAAQTQHAAAQQTRTLPAAAVTATLFDRLQHPHWTELAERCLACGNCTAVCPSCFCHRETEQPALDGGASEHRREWDSCFNVGHSYIHGLTVRDTTRLRYRQWLTHKLAGWQQQYGRSGCTGCGRCITWCPVGIDITEAVHTLCQH